MGLCVWLRERECVCVFVCVCVCVCVRERERDCVCVCVCVYRGLTLCVYCMCNVRVNPLHPVLWLTVSRGPAASR